MSKFNRIECTSGLKEKFVHNYCTNALSFDVTNVIYTILNRLKREN
jgi:hypothetical protein